MHFKLFSLLLLILTHFNTANADIKGDNFRETKQNIDQVTELDEIHKALTEFSKLNPENNMAYEQKRREMLDSVEKRFFACDLDNDDTLDIFETTQCLPQVARQFRKVDIDNDNLITLDEISMLAKEFTKDKIAEKTKKNKSKAEAALKNKPSKKPNIDNTSL